jgi:regulator of protease activity HflC (stomatin/prohibitin superfamily)
VEVHPVEEHEAAVLFRDGRVQGRIDPGVHAYWRGGSRFALRKLDLREQTVDIAGQEILTSDHVTLRVNALVIARVVDPVLCLQKTPDWSATLYKEAQFALRTLISTKTLEGLLAEKDSLAKSLMESVVPRGTEVGVEVLKVGIKDLILPGEIRTLLNKVTEARKAAEAAIITRREETASMRHQANTAKLLENNPALLRLKELETLEKVASYGKLSVNTTEGKLAERIVNLI